MRDRLGHLIEGLLDVAGDDEDVADVAEIELLVEIDAAIDGIAVIERGNPPHRLRAETRARPIRRRRVERHADEGRLEIADRADILAIGRLHEGVDPREGGLMAAAEAGDRSIDDRPGALEAEEQRALDLLLLLALRNAREPLQVAIAAKLRCLARRHRTAPFVVLREGLAACRAGQRRAE